MSGNFEDLLKKLSNFRGFSDDSRKVKKGFIFVAVKGLKSDGHDYISQAIKNGVSVVVGEKDLNFGKTPYIKVEDSRLALGLIASAWFGNPSEKLKVIGVTGTDGKTTVTHLIYHILCRQGKNVGLISTVAAKIGNKEYETGFHVTNPDPASLQGFLAKMVEEGCEFAVVEVTSHGIDQKRIAGTKFHTCVITNITREHLDYHKTFESYREVKLSFLKLAQKNVILNQDDASYTFLKSRLGGKNIVSYSRTEDLKGILPAFYNESNAAAAIATTTTLGVSKDDAIRAIHSFKFPPGRLESVANNLGIDIYIDFAHTPNALSGVLTYLKSKTRGRLVAVFGCAGERDPRKRFKMGKISGKLADLSIFTAEDPRSEDVFKILERMAQGAKSVGAIEGKDFLRIPERMEAIACAIHNAKAGDTIVITGKGHEKSLAYGGFEHPWSDEEAVRVCLGRDRSVSAIVLAAGKGVRMRSTLPKILHKVCGRPLIAYTLQNLRMAQVGEIVAVASFKKNMVVRRVGGAVKIAVQKNPKGGTADAAAAGLSLVSRKVATVLVMYGDDTAFYTPQTIKKVIRKHKDEDAKLTFVTLTKDRPLGLGRIVRDRRGGLVGIVEEKDATDKQRKIKEVNDGLYVFDRKWLEENLSKIPKSPISGEYYIVELIKMAIDQNQKVTAYNLPNPIEWQGVNTQEELKEAEEKMEEKLKEFNEKYS